MITTYGIRVQHWWPRIDFLGHGVVFTSGVDGSATVIVVDPEALRQRDLLCCYITRNHFGEEFRNVPGLNHDIAREVASWCVVNDDTDKTWYDMFIVVQSWSDVHHELMQLLETDEAAFYGEKEYDDE